FFPLPWNYKRPNFVCPAIYGRYPHEKDCSMFYECRFALPHLMKCIRGKLYDAKKEQCNDARRVKCIKPGKDQKDKDKDRDHDHDHKKDKVVVFRCPYIWGTFPHPFDCSKYFVCLYNVPALFQCYRNTLFDSYSRKCNDRRRVKCGDRLDRDQLKTSRRPTTNRQTTPIPPEERPTVTTVAPTTRDPNAFGCPFPYGRYPNPKDCSQYYECRFAIPTLHQCANGTLYDERKEECLEDTLVRCGDRPGGVVTDDSCSELSSDEDLSSARIFYRG
ncbi:uncharacterized protein TNCT_293171, partial [Trichonephila clavata]